MRWASRLGELRGFLRSACERLGERLLASRRAVWRWRLAGQAAAEQHWIVCAVIAASALLHRPHLGLDDLLCLSSLTFSLVLCLR